MNNKLEKTQPKNKVASKSKSVPTEQKDENPVATEDAPSGDTRDELIRKTAYAFYEARSYVNGYDLEDWLKAEMQIDQKFGNNIPSPEPMALQI